VDQLAALKEIFKDCLREVVREELSALHDTAPAEASSAPRDCMNTKQLKAYLQCSDQSIRNWRNRSDNPLPCGYIGNEPRFYLSEIREWSHENERRRKNKSNQDEEKAVTNPVRARRMRPTLMVANQKKGGKHVHVQAVERAHN
jgi:hypothetical protein